MSWGYQGHYKISFESALSFNQEMSQFIEWRSTLAEHASDADYRKDEDPSEGPKHYIDIDNYPEFIANGRIPQTLDSVIAIYGEDFVIDQGILPWATVTTYDSLVQCFLRRDWYKAVLFASDLGHYVGDGHMPLHITRNYNGQYTGNSGIHSRYESAMISTFIGQINYPGDAIYFVEDVNAYVFDYLYANYMYADSVLLADDYAEGVAGNTSSYTYKEALWNKTKNFTIPLFARASNTLAELIYSAWVDAGKPLINPSGLNEEILKGDVVLQQNYPNPCNRSTQFSVYVATDSQITLKVMNLTGEIIETIENSYLQRGTYSYTWNSADQSAGIYLVVLDDGTSKSMQKMLVVH
jgi:hypothetical protein